MADLPAVGVALQDNTKYRELIVSVDAERSRIARELHDDVGHRTALMAMHLSKLVELLPEKTPEMEYAIQSLKNEIDQMAESLRTTSHRIHPAIVEDLGLPASMQSLVEAHNELGGDAMLVMRDLPEVSRSVATAFYRITQEALSNVTKHAKGVPVQVTLFPEGDDLQLCVEDDGPGFDFIEVHEKDGIGLVGMNERARLVGGYFSIRTEFGKGTRIEVCVPLSEVNR